MRQVVKNLSWWHTNRNPLKHDLSKSPCCPRSLIFANDLHDERPFRVARSRACLQVYVTLRRRINFCHSRRLILRYPAVHLRVLLCFKSRAFATQHVCIPLVLKTEAKNNS